MSFTLSKKKIEFYQRFPRPFIGFLCKQGKKNLIGAEVGVLAGDNALDILERLPIKKLYLIDPYDKYENYSDFDQEELVKAKDDALQKLSKFDSKIVWINELSNKAHKKIPKKLDFIYIDANHNYKFVKKDMENYYPLLKKDGILAGHDIGPLVHPDILSAFYNFVKGTDFQHYIIGCDWIIIKN